MRPPVQPVVKKGDILIRDLRLWHAGMPNETDKERIMIAIGYQVSSQSYIIGGEDPGQQGNRPHGTPTTAREMCCRFRSATFSRSLVGSLSSCGQTSCPTRKQKRPDTRRLSTSGQACEYEDAVVGAALPELSLHSAKHWLYSYTHMNRRWQFRQEPR